MGVELDNYSTRESMLFIESFLNNTVLNVVEEISMNMILSARNDERVKDCIMNLDLTIPGEKELLIEGGYGDRSQMSDVLDGTFFYEFSKRLIRNKKTVFLVGETKEQIRRLRTYLDCEYERMNIIGDAYFEQYAEEGGLINEINSHAPDVILSIISSPRQELFLLEHKTSIHAKLWYGMNDRFQHFTMLERLKRGGKSLIRRTLFKHSLINYYKEQ